MTLTAQQEKFCQAMADGMTQADSYRFAYKAAAMKDATIWKRASELMGNGAVAGRVSALKAALASKALWTREDSVQTLKRIADGLGGETKPGEAVSAVKELNAMHGFNAPSKIELGGTLVTRVELVAMRDDSKD